MLFFYDPTSSRASTANGQLLIPPDKELGAPVAAATIVMRRLEPIHIPYARCHMGTAELCLEIEPVTDTISFRKLE